MSENRPQMTVQSAVEVVAAVVDVEQGEKVLRIYREEQAPVDFVCMAHRHGAHGNCSTCSHR